MQITYQKKDGSIMQRTRNTELPYKIGETTSMGWKVLNVEYEYKNKYYPLYEYNNKIYKNRQRSLRIQETIKIFIKEFRTFMYYCMAVGLINIFKIILGI